MEHFLLCCNGILPILLLMLLGYGLRRLPVLDAGAFAALDRLCFRVLIPAMLFVSVYTADFSMPFQPSAMAFVVLAGVGNFLLVFLLVARWVPAPAAAPPPSAPQTARAAPRPPPSPPPASPTAACRRGWR